MDQLIPGLAALVEAFRDVFYPQDFSTFQALIAGWAPPSQKRPGLSDRDRPLDLVGLEAERHGTGNVREHRHVVEFANQPVNA